MRAVTRSKKAGSQPRATAAVVDSGIAQTALGRAIEKAGSQEKLAALIGVTQALVSQWVNGAPIPNKYFPLIEKATGVSAYDLLDDELAKLASKKRSLARA